MATENESMDELLSGIPMQSKTLDELIADYLQADVAGTPLDRTEILQRYPHHADALRIFWESHDRLKQVARRNVSVAATNTRISRSPIGACGDSLNGAPSTLRDADDRPVAATADTHPDRLNVARVNSPDAVGDDAEFFGDYELLECIARGGMGIVFKARQRKLDRIVALKMVRANQGVCEQDLQRFHSEAVAAAQLNHPHIVPIYEVNEFQGQPYFTMPFLNGGRLSDRIKDGPLPAREAAELLLKMAEAVDFAHQQGVIHRDLKPGNVLFDSQGQPKVTDFGLAKRVESDQELTATGQILGTPNYMSPEQARGDHGVVGRSTDIYSLGATLYALLTGRPPSQSAGVAETLFQVVHQDAVPPRRLNSLVPKDLETICLKCLEKQPQHRYADAAALAEDLRRYLQLRPILARRHHPVSRLVRWSRRNPVSATLAFSLLTTVLLVVSISLAAAIQLSRARTTAQQNELRAIAAEKDTRDQLWHSHLNEARARRWSGRHERRYEGLRALEAAAAIRRSPELRNEAIACLTLADMRPHTGTYPFDAAQDRVVFDRDYTKFAQAHGAAGHITVGSFPAGQQRLAIPCGGKQVRRLRFDDSGELLLVLWADKSGLTVYRVADGTAVLQQDDRFHAAADFSPQGNRLATVAADGVVRIFDLDAQTLLQEFDTNATPDVLRYSPDGTKLASSAPAGAYVWDVDNGQQLQHWAPCQIRDIAWHPDSRLVAGAGADKVVHVWDSENGKERRRLRGHGSQITDVAFSRGTGAYLASYDWQSTVRLWDHEAGLQLLNVPNIHGHLEDGLQFSRNNDYLFPAFSSQGHFRVWEVALPDGFAILKPPQETSAHHVRDITLSADGQLLVAGTDHYLHFWDAIHRRYLGRLGPAPSMSVAFDEQGRHLISAGWESIVRWPFTRASQATPSESSVRNTELAVAEPEILWAQGQQVRGMSMRPDALAFISGGDAFQFRPIDRESAPRRLDAPQRRNHTNSAISAGGKWLAATTMGGGVDVWDLHSGEHVTYLELNGLNEIPVAFSPDSQHLVAGGETEFVFWRVGTWRRVREVPRQWGAPLFAFHPQGQIFACAHATDTIRVLDTRDFQELCRLETPEWTYLSCLAFSPDGSMLAAGTEHFEVFLWQFADWLDQLKTMGLAWPEQYARVPKHASPPKFTDLTYAGHASQNSPIDALRKEANSLFRQGDYQRAAKQQQLVGELLSLNHQEPYLAPILFVMANDLDSYHRYCGWLLDSRQISEDITAKSQTAFHCCIVPPADEHINPVLRYARTATDTHALITGIPYYELVRSLAELRAGNYNEAVQYANRVLQKAPESPERFTIAQIVRCLARLELGASPDQAQLDLTDARSAIDARQETYRDAGLTPEHVEHLISLTLYNEAQQRLSRPRPPAPSQ